jgi:hypothetical protein
MQKVIGVLIILLLFSCSKQRLWVKGKVQQKSFAREIPVQIRNGLIFVEVAVNGRLCNFLMDTGAPTLIDARLVEELGLETKAFGTAVDSYDRRNRIDYTILNTVSLDGINFTRQGALISDFRSIPVFDCLNVDGLLGANLMRNACWQMDCQNEVIRIQEDCEGFIYSANSIVMPFSVNSQGTPKLSVILGDSLRLNYVTLDFGSSSGLSLDLEAVEDRFDPAGADLFTTGAAGVGLYGVELDSIWFMMPEGLLTSRGDTILTGLRARIRRKGGHLFGTGILREFRSTIDWQNNQLVLEPVGGRPSPAWHNFGCALQPNGAVLEVAQLVYPSMAVESGLMLGDTVVAINSRPVNATDFCEARALFGAPEPIGLTVQRQEKRLEVKLLRQDLFAVRQ